MTICIQHEAGTFYTSGYDSVTAVVNAIESGAEIDVWWFDQKGSRYRETMWFATEHLVGVRTERDDG